MTILIEELLSTFVQLLLFSLVPFVWWKVATPSVTFFNWLGLKKITPISKKAWLFSGLILVLFMSVGYLSLKMLPDTAILANRKFIPLTIPTFLALLLYAFFQTALAEEIFFRGFLGKRLIEKFGFIVGNSLQAIIFGILHGLLFFQQSQTSLIIIMVTVFTALVGFLLGYLNEKLNQGSIFLGWLLHAFANIISTIFLLMG